MIWPDDTANDQRLWLGNTEGSVPLGRLWVLRDHNEMAIAFHSMLVGEILNCRDSTLERRHLEVNQAVNSCMPWSDVL